MDKLTKAQAVYFPQTILGTPGRPGASCGTCALRAYGRYGEEECLYVHKDGSSDCRVSFASGVCALYIQGGASSGSPKPTVPRLVAGYYEGRDVPTHCGNCEYFEGVGGSSLAGTCRKVDGLVNANACCNLWQGEGADDKG